MQIQAKLGSEPAHGSHRGIDDGRNIRVSFKYRRKTLFDRDADLQVGPEGPQ
jgi:hypothetical protein